MRIDIAPEDAILRQARLGRYDLIVMGVGRPAGETLYFGRIAAAVLENSQHSILFVSSTRLCLARNGQLMNVS